MNIKNFQMFEETTNSLHTLFCERYKFKTATMSAIWMDD